MSANNTNVPISVTSSTVQHPLPTSGSEQHVFTPFREQRRQQIESQPESEEERLIRLWDELRIRQLDALGWTDTSRTVPEFYRETTAPWTWGARDDVVNDSPLGRGERRIEGVGMRAAMARSRSESEDNALETPELGAASIDTTTSRPTLMIETRSSSIEPQASSQTNRLSHTEAQDLPLPSSPASMMNLIAEAQRLADIFRTIGEPLVERMLENDRLNLPRPIISDDRIARVRRLDADISDLQDHLASMMGEFRPSTTPVNQDGQRERTDIEESEAVNTNLPSGATPGEMYEPIHPAISEAEHLRLQAHISYLERSITEMRSRFVPAGQFLRYLIPAPDDREAFYTMVTDLSDLYDYLYGDLAMFEEEAAKEDAHRSSTVTMFLETLRILSPEDLTAELQDCSICREPYDAGGCDGGVVCLPCGHTFGRQCISLWLSTSTSVTCPMCRAILFQAPPAPPPVEPTSLDVAAYNQTWAARISTQDPHVGRLGEWRGAENFLDYIAHVNYLVSQNPDVRFDGVTLPFNTNQAISFVDTAYGPIDARHLRPTGSRWQGERSFTGIVLDIFRLFISRPEASGGRDSEIAGALARLMGRLYEGLWEWTVHGPSARSLIDPATIPLVEDALRRWIEFEDEMLTRREQLAPATE